jgi:hypothetical protein
MSEDRSSPHFEATALTEPQTRDQRFPWLTPLYTSGTALVSMVTTGNGNGGHTARMWCSTISAFWQLPSPTLDIAVREAGSRTPAVVEASKYVWDVRLNDEHLRGRVYVVPCQRCSTSTWKVAYTLCLLMCSAYTLYPPKDARRALGRWRTHCGLPTAVGIVSRRPFKRVHTCRTRRSAELTDGEELRYVGGLVGLVGLRRD